MIGRSPSPTSPISPFRRMGTTLSLAVLLLAAGCHKKTSGVDPSSLGPSADTNVAAAPAPTATLSADPLIIDLGQSTVLTWHTSNASVVSIDGIGQVNLNGTQTVSPSNPTNFHLVAKGDGGTTEANIRVTVRMNTANASTVMDTNTTDTSHGVTDDIFHQNVPDAFFDYDSYALRADAQAAAAQAAGFLVAHPNIKVLIGGYCDDRGSAEYNLALGENRANSAKAALVTGRRVTATHSRHQLRQGEAVLHGRSCRLLAGESPCAVHDRSLAERRVQIGTAVILAQSESLQWL